MGIDVLTLALAAGIASVIEVGVLFAQHRIDRAHAGPGWWTLGMAGVAIASFVGIFRATPALESLATVAGLALFVGGLLLLYVGVVRFTGGRERLGWVVGAWVACVAAVGIFAVADEAVVGFQVLRTASIIVVSFAVVLVLVRTDRHAYARSARLLAVVFATLGAFFVLRIPLLVFADHPHDPFASTPSTAGSYGVLLVAGLLVTFGLVLMSFERLVHEVRESSDRADRAERAEMVARLAGGIAHNFNNLMTAVEGNAELLAMTLPPGDPRRAEVDAIHDSAMRATTLTRRLLEFGRREDPAVARVVVDDAVAGLEPMLDTLVGDEVAVDVATDAPGASVIVDPTLLEQIVVSLILNAHDAMPHGGRVTISTALETVARDDPRLRPPAAPGRYVGLAVADTGGGFPPEALPHVFDPFFSTKEMGWGPDLGLSSIDGLAAHAGGFVSVASEVGKGSAFTVHLPLATAAAG